MKAIILSVLVLMVCGTVYAERWSSHNWQTGEHITGRESTYGSTTRGSSYNWQTGEQTTYRYTRDAFGVRGRSNNWTTGECTTFRGR